MFPGAEVISLLFQVHPPPSPPHSLPWDQLEWATYGLSCALLSGGLSLGEAPGDKREARHVFPSLLPCAVHWAGGVPQPVVTVPLKAWCPFWSPATVPLLLWAQGVVTVATALAPVLAPSLVLPLYPHPSANCSLVNKLP